MWVKKDPISDVPNIFEYVMTIVSFVLAVLIAVLLAPFVNFYLYNNDFPDSSDREQIYDDLRSDAWGVVLSSVTGFIVAVCVTFAVKFGKYIALFITLIEQVIMVTCLSLLSTWLMWKYNPTTDSTLLTMIPLAITQISAFITLEFASVFGQGGRVLYNFMALGLILGAFVGASRSIQQNYFYFGGSDPFVWDVELGIAFGKSILDTAFFVGSCSFVSACITRSKAGGTILWHPLALILSVGLACTFSMYIELADYVPVIESSAARYVLGAVIALVTLLLSAITFHPVKKMGDTQAHGQRKNLISPNTSAGGPIAANAILLV